MQYTLQDNIERQRKENEKAIPQVALSAQNKTGKGRYFLEGSGLTNATVVDNPSDWKSTVEPKYKVYTANLSQAGTAIPTAIVLENTTGATAVFTRTGVGVYVITFSEDILTVESVAFITANKSDTTVNVKLASANSMEIYTRSAGLAADDVLLLSSLEIRNYN